MLQQEKSAPGLGTVVKNILFRNPKAFRRVLFPSRRRGTGISVVTGDNGIMVCFCKKRAFQF